MDLEMGSDDDLFLEDRDRSPTKLQVWSPRQCEPKWMFNDETICQNPDANSTESAQILSYQADLLFARKQFQDALIIYKKGVAVVPMRFVLLRRSFLEGAARCCTYLKDHSEALSLAAMLMKESLTVDQRMTAHSLMAFVHAASGNHPEAIKSLQICIQWQRSNPHFWLKLAESYRALQSQHTLHKVYTEHAQNQSASRPSLGFNHTGSLQQLEYNKTGSDSSVNCCTQTKDDSSHGEISTSFPPEVDKQPNENDKKTVPNCQSLQTGDSGYLDNNISIPNFRQTPFTAVTETLDSSNKSKNERCHSMPCSSFIGLLLDKLDNLAITDGDANATLCRDDVVPELSCIECRPKLVAASCLLRTRLLLKSVEHSVGSFAKVKNEHRQREIEQSLPDLKLSPDTLGVLHHHARVIFRKGCRRTEAGVKDSEVDEGAPDLEGNNVSREEFESRWFPWVLTVQ